MVGPGLVALGDLDRGLEVAGLGDRGYGCHDERGRGRSEQDASEGHGMARRGIKRSMRAAAVDLALGGVEEHPAGRGGALEAVQDAGLGRLHPGLEELALAGLRG